MGFKKKEEKKGILVIGMYTQWYAIRNYNLIVYKIKLNKIANMDSLC